MSEFYETSAKKMSFIDSIPNYIKKDIIILGKNFVSDKYPTLIDYIRSSYKNHYGSFVYGINSSNPESVYYELHYTNKYNENITIVKNVYFQNKLTAEQVKNFDKYHVVIFADSHESTATNSVPQKPVPAKPVVNAFDNIVKPKTCEPPTTNNIAPKVDTSTDVYGNVFNDILKSFGYIPTTCNVNKTPENNSVDNKTQTYEDMINNILKQYGYNVSTYKTVETKQPDATNPPVVPKQPVETKPTMASKPTDESKPTIQQEYNKIITELITEIQKQINDPSYHENIYNDIAIIDSLFNKQPVAHHYPQVGYLSPILYNIYI